MPLIDLNKIKLKALVKPYQLQVNEIIKTELLNLGPESKIKEACLYALDGDGKRFRPAIALMIANQQKTKWSVGLAALSVELFHTASLIADDLPLMDDDSIRRNRPATHVEFGNDVALLSSYALIGTGYQCLFRLKERLEGLLPDIERRSFLALELLALNNGLEGAPLGQWLDLSLDNPTQSQLEDLFYRKTILFFETAFVFGWLYAGGDLLELDTIKKASFHFGMAFQIYDDFCDLESDKKKGKRVNYPLELGKEKARKDLIEHLEKSANALSSINAFPEEFTELFLYLKKQVS